MTKKIIAGLALLGVLASVGGASATPLNTTFGLTVYHYVNSGPGTINDPEEQALASNPAAILSNVVFSGTYAGAIDFTDGGSNNILTFLNSAGGTLTGVTTLLNTDLSQGGFTDSTLMDFSFTIAAQDSGLMTHDDGFSIWNATNTTNLIDFSFPVAVQSDPFNLAPGTYNLWYAEVNGLPAALIMDVTSSVSSVPEPGTLALFGVGLVGLWFVRRRRTA